MRRVQVQGEMIRLGQFLKIADAVGTGGEAKVRIQTGEVQVNGVVDTRRGRQLHDGDQVALAGVVYLVAMTSTERF